MSSAPPLFPVGPGKPAAPFEPRGHAAAAGDAGVPPAVDEDFLTGCRRRAAAFAADLKSPTEAATWSLIAVLSAGLCYSYWPSLAALPSTWSNAQYQHGWIVPLLTVALIFWWRQPVVAVPTSARVAGLAVMAVSFAVRLGFAYYRVRTFDMYTFVPALAGVFLLAGGWRMIRWAGLPIALLIFMYPLPEGHQRYLTGPLQTFNTIVATFLLQTLGFDAIRDGNRIDLFLDKVYTMNVVDACAGLKMLTIFIWLCAVVIVVAGLEWWENLVIAVSAIPIAILANTLRITTAGMLYGVSPKWAETFHDSTPAAILMMVVAVAAVLLEMKLLSLVLVTETSAPGKVAVTGKRLPVAGGVGGRPPASPFAAIPGMTRGEPRADRGTQR